MMRALILLLHAVIAVQAQIEAPGRIFLNSVFGGPADLSLTCHPHDDLWMIPGRHDERAQRSIASIPDQDLTNSVAQGVVIGSQQPHLYFFEVRDGKVDARFTLNSIYQRHRELALFFLHSALSQNMVSLRRIVTDANKVTFAGPKAPPAEMGQYSEIISAFPVVRVSDPKHDAVAKSVTYLIPLGTNALSLKMIKAEGSWKIDTTDGIEVPTWSLFK